MQAKGGIAERSDRLVAVLVMTGLSDIFDLPILLTIVLWVLAAASTITVVQRMVLRTPAGAGRSASRPDGHGRVATARDRLVDYAFRVGWAITRHAPEPVAAQAARRRRRPGHPASARHRRPAARGATCAALCPDRTTAELRRPAPAGDAVVLPLLARGVPAAVVDASSASSTPS